MNVDQLAALPPEAYLEPERFVSPLDALLPADAPYRAEQFATGKRTSDENDAVILDWTGVWSAIRKNGYTTSYERIGYHSGTVELLRGFLAGTAEILVHRLRDGKSTTTIIRPSLKAVAS